MAFPESFLQDLKMRNDITDVVSGYVNLKRRGRNMVGLCPTAKKLPLLMYIPKTVRSIVLAAEQAEMSSLLL